MGVSVVVPYRAGDPHRDRSWAWVRAWYAEHLPEAEVVVADSTGPWNKPEAVNRAVRAATEDLLVLADADVFLGDVAHLRLALDAVRQGRWVIPHRMVKRLTEDATEDILSNPVTFPDPDPRFIRLPYIGFPGGGVVVLSRQMFDSVNGMDEAFAGWGGEDVAFACALDTLVGRHLRFSADLWHLYHDPGPRMRHPEFERNRRRMQAYRRAVRKPERMRALVGLEGLEGSG